MSDDSPLTVGNPTAAPIIYFDALGGVNVKDGVVGVALGAMVAAAHQDRSVGLEPVIVAHLRCSIKAAGQLHKALSSVLLLAAPTEGGKN